MRFGNRVLAGQSFCIKYFVNGKLFVWCEFVGRPVGVSFVQFMRIYSLLYEAVIKSWKYYRFELTSEVRRLHHGSPCFNRWMMCVWFSVFDDALEWPFDAWHFIDIYCWHVAVSMNRAFRVCKWWKSCREIKGLCELIEFVSKLFMNAFWMFEIGFVYIRFVGEVECILILHTIPCE